MLCYITKISKIESNSQPKLEYFSFDVGCVISQRYPKLKAIHNLFRNSCKLWIVVLYHKDIQNWKQFTTVKTERKYWWQLCYITKISKIESNSQQRNKGNRFPTCCVISQRYPKLKAIHNGIESLEYWRSVVLYHKDIQNWKQFTTNCLLCITPDLLCYITKISKIESNSQHMWRGKINNFSCVISQRYPKLKAYNKLRCFYCKLDLHNEPFVVNPV